jgi:predicted amidohydrolase YtcJ
MAARLTTYLVVGIVAATLIAGLIVGAQRDDYEGPVDLIVHNAHVFTADADDPTAEAVAIRGNQILRVGSNREINRLRRPQTTVIDAGGAAVLPGFNDANVRLVEGGLGLLRDGPDDDAQAPVTRDVRLEAIRAAVAEAHRNGITSVHDVGATPADIALYDELRKSGDLALRVYAALEIDGPFDEGLLTRLATVWKDYSDDPRFKTGAVTLDLEPEGSGVPADRRTASPLAEAREAGAADAATPEPEPALDADELNRFVRLLDAQGWQVLIGAHSVRTVTMALDAYRHAQRSNPSPERGRRHRIEGAAAIAEPDLPRFEAHGAIASVQPADALADGTLAALEEHEAPVVFGSGWPSASLSPLAGLQAALVGLVANAAADGAPEAEPAMSMEAAVTAYTAGGAHASFDEKRKGTISPGMLADLVVLTDDIFTAPAARLASTAVAFTIFDGRVVYRRDARLTNPPVQ